jgi:hypothetical protein
MDATDAATTERRDSGFEFVDRDEDAKEFRMSDRLAMIAAIAVGILLAIVLAVFGLL